MNAERKARPSLNSSVDQKSIASESDEGSKSQKKLKIKLEDDCIDAFLNKAINIEYVFLILTGISKIMEAQINKFEENADHSQKMAFETPNGTFSATPGGNILQKLPSNATLIETQTVLEQRLRDKSATTVEIQKSKNKKTKIVMKFLDISQPKQWGFNLFGEKDEE